MKSTQKRIKTYEILKIDPALAPFAADIDLRMQNYTRTRDALLSGGDISAFANGYLYYGLHRTDSGWVFREWAPGADAMHFVGDFNDWNTQSHPMQKRHGGIWEIALPGIDTLRQGQYYAVRVTRGSESFQRVPAYAGWVEQDRSTYTYTARVQESTAYPWKNTSYTPQTLKPLFLYEAHIGMAQEQEGIGSYRDFADKILPRIQAAGYTAVQLMGIAEHPYYASFGYQVSNFFAPSGWFGPPEDLKYLIDTAHGLGLAVIMDLVHSHSAINEGDGLSRFDGTDDQYFHTGERGLHPAWKTKLFNYGKHEVMHFLLSNIKYWLEEYRVDGFRFDGVTSMLYHDHGLGRVFADYQSYFSPNTDVEAVTYLQMATELIHTVRPHAVAIAEDMSGMPGMCLPIRKGGLGFDYRLSMGLPDFWTKTLRERTDEQWDIGRMWYELTTCRPQERAIAYCESHDQALVGDKTLIFWMCDAEMYTGMDRAYHSSGIDRAIALHKLIRLATISLGGDGWLNFMGNEFGHPEWIDFPREGNGWSYHYARRQWSLRDNGYLKYSWLAEFDRAMLLLVRKTRLFSAKRITKLWDDFDQKLLAFSRNGVVFAFNFHPSCSQKGFVLPVDAPAGTRYRLLLYSDDALFGGTEPMPVQREYTACTLPDRGSCIVLDLPRRTAVVLRRIAQRKPKT